MSNGQERVLELWDFQQPATEFLVKHKRALNGMSMGLGKTVVTWSAVNAIKPHSILLIGTTAALSQWKRIAQQFWPGLWDKFVQIEGTPLQRKVLWQTQPSCVAVTYQILLRDQDMLQGRGWGYDMIIADECHKFIRNRNTKTFNLLKQLARHSTYLYLVTGSPISRGAQDFWTYMHLIDRTLHSSYWRWVNTFCNVVETPFGKEIIGTKNEDQLRTVLRQNAILIQKKDVHLKKKVRQIIGVDMTTAQKRAYTALDEEMILELDEGLLLASTALAKITRLRQLLCCPSTIHTGLGIGGGFEYIVDTLQDLPREERHCVIFAPFRDALDDFHDYLVKLATFQDSSIFIFRGGMKADQLDGGLQAWKGSRGIALCTIAYAQSFDMETCDKAFFMGYSWDPNENFQAEDRVDRLTNKNSILNMYYIQMRNSIDEHVLEVVIEKSTNMAVAYNDQHRLARLLKQYGKGNNTNTKTNTNNKANQDRDRDRDN